MDRHVANARRGRRLARDQPACRWVSYPRLPQNRTPLAGEILPARPGLGVHHRRQGRLRGGRAAGRRLPAAVPRRQHRRHPLADHPSGLDHPPPARRRAARAAGAGPDVVRLSIGIETADDIIADLEQALAAAAGHGGAAGAATVPCRRYRADYRAAARSGTASPGSDRRPRPWPVPSGRGPARSTP